MSIETKSVTFSPLNSMKILIKSIKTRRGKIATLNMFPSMLGGRNHFFDR